MNILIRPLEVKDAAVSYKWRNDADIWKYTGSKPTLEITEIIEREWLINTLPDKTKSRFAIIVDGNYVGNVQLTDIVSEQSAEYHIFLGEKNFWGKGVAAEATYQILTYAKESLRLSEVYLNVKSENTAAIKSYKKSGFKIIDDDSESLKMVCKLEELPPPVVSIFCMVYNHEKFLKQTLDGFLMQNTNFNTLIVIGEDCSTDNSRKVLLDYSNKYPGKFKILLHDKNIGANANQQIILENCRGKYVAMCEGDDYWTDPLKLQKQIDFLEENSQYVMCFHKVNVLKTDGEIVEDFLTKVPEKYQERGTLLVKGNYIHTPSVVFRNNLIKIPDIFYESPLGDFLIYVLLTEYGKIGYIHESMAVYRHNVGVLRKTVDNTFKNALKMNLIMLKIVDSEEDNKIVIKRIIDFVFQYILNLPLNVLKNNLKNVPVRFLRRYLKRH
ncbi:hypothetical protein ASG31_03805 [Chryseobacterium sp. Leaf404]|uniref:GNAT family N-acetyltransferase n=1 Tax=unclassified Chryseobacterium TaxID=2593645 RepID=UPI0006F87962|nr:MULTISPECIES: GNAT family N-acetyltransferase [unclassified Chryseobacterium]KQT17873.1 hypothetical protein ASG31_03805 [Chryseobacterium sp. Leaf404]